MAKVRCFGPKVTFCNTNQQFASKNFLRLIWRPFEAILSSKSPFAHAQVCIRGVESFIFLMKNLGRPQKKI